MNTWQNEERILAILGANMRDRNIYYDYAYESIAIRDLCVKYGISHTRIQQIVDKQRRRLTSSFAQELLKMNNVYNWHLGDYGMKMWNLGFRAKEMENPEDMGIENLDISVRSYHCLKRAHYSTIGEIPLDFEELKKIKNLGNKSAKDIIQKVQDFLGRRRVPLC